MSIPRKHHYLPKWYLARWSKDGCAWEYTRQGPTRILRAKRRRPSETGYQEHLYTIPEMSAEDAALYETRFLQVIDDRGAKAIALAEANETAGPREKGALVQFLLSMVHRTPDSISRLEESLKNQLKDRPEFHDANDAVYREGALSVFADLLQSDLILSRLFELSTFVITIGSRGHDILTCDCPVLLSNGLHHFGAFAILPIGPRRLLVLAADKSIVDYLAGQDARTLSAAINEALVVQASGVVIAASSRPFAFIEKRFGNERLKAAHPFNPKTGLVRWAL